MGNRGPALWTFMTVSDTGSNLGISDIEDSDDRDEFGKPVELNLNNKSQLTKTERVSKDWRSPVYAFYHPVPKITYLDEGRCHEFKSLVDASITFDGSLIQKTSHPLETWSNMLRNAGAMRFGLQLANARMQQRLG